MSRGVSSVVRASTVQPVDHGGDRGSANRHRDVERERLPERQSPAVADSLRVKLRRWFARRALRLFLSAYEIALALARFIGPRRRPISNSHSRIAAAEAAGCKILLTGTFHSDNWINAHLRPLAAAERVRSVHVVSTYPIPPTPKVVAIYPPRWLRHTIGGVPARMLIFAWSAVRLQPHYVGGFHLLLNGMLAALAARLVGARSMYFCVGGPPEVLGGGIRAENRLFGRLEVPDPGIEQRLVRIVSAFDLVITMGTRTVDFFQGRGVRGALHVVSGGINQTSFHQAETATTNDLVLVGRLAEIKRIDVFLRAVRLVRDAAPGVSATIVGDGECRAALEELARELEIADCVTFVGHQSNVAAWLRRSRIFVLTSDSEGLALSLMEAMMCGLPAVVSDVGDLGDLVADGVNGYLVPRRSPADFAGRIVELLTDAKKLAAFSRAAHFAALQHETANVVRRWDEIL